MFSVKVKSNIKAEVINNLRKTVDERFVYDVQREVVDGQIKRLIASGTSPVQGYDNKKRYDAYKDKDNYPGKKKPNRPVNLSLTGIMLSWYRTIKVSGIRISLGIPSSAPQDVKDRAEGNNVGANGIPARRFVPLKGETYAISVLRKLKSLYAQRIKTLISK